MHIAALHDHVRSEIRRADLSCKVHLQLYPAAMLHSEYSIGKYVPVMRSSHWSCATHFEHDDTFQHVHMEQSGGHYTAPRSHLVPFLRDSNNTARMTWLKCSRDRKHMCRSGLLVWSWIETGSTEPSRNNGIQASRVQLY